ncbi:UDP-N-acetylglucosamine--LPS N-acetylglucosamine transferase [Pseudarthrobacter sp. lyk4-40-TYG-27]|uniref:UDP-N-acetylglucosamine--LPS N-acetylglucosamine transferase n=1 Tax=Pseudarthrobacter sp. lyk4-40-TYG-27 TaxID=3040305 RepID=UPI0025561E0F|nr:UDP-N-acetylglucosamine--LPS N-acetylglucosamine transferase [Pseudarthrobacter sp. lyk4-40-TYG-27]
MKKILCVCSSGGHLDQMLAIFPAPDEYEVVFATFNKPDALAKLEGYQTYWLYWPTNRSLKNAIRNTALAIRVMRIERPDIVISTGAAAALPFFMVGKVVRRSKNVFIECIDRISLPTLTAKLVRPFTDLYVCQWETQLPGYSDRVNLGRSR